MHLWVTPRGMRGESDTGLSPSVRWVDSGRTRWPLRNLLISRDLVTTQDNPLCLVPMPGPACLAPVCTPAGSSPGNQVGLWENLLVLFLFFLQAQFNTPSHSPVPVLLALAPGVTDHVCSPLPGCSGSALPRREDATFSRLNSIPTSDAVFSSYLDLANFPKVHSR